MFSVKSRLYTHFSISSVGIGTRIKLINIIGKWSDKSVLTMALLKSLFMMQLVIMLSMAVAVCLVTLVGLFIVGIILNSNIKLTKLWTFLFASKSRRLILKSPARKKVFLTVVLSERIFLKKVSHTFKWLSGGLHITLKIILPVWLFSISIDKDSISSQFMLKSLRSLSKSESRINITVLLPLRLFLIWCTGMCPSNWNKEFWLILLSFVYVSVRQIILSLVFKDL